jgi:hypothetical protein
MACDALALCPFCGSSARQSHSGGWFGTGCDGSTKCPAFLSGLMHRTQAEADAAWNRRATVGVTAARSEPKTGEPPTESPSP